MNLRAGDTLQCQLSFVAGSAWVPQWTTPAGALAPALSLSPSVMNFTVPSNFTSPASGKLTLSQTGALGVVKQVVSYDLVINAAAPPGGNPNLIGP